MIEIIYQSTNALVVRAGKRFQYITEYRGRFYTEDITIHGSCASCCGPEDLPCIAEAMCAVHLWLLRRDRLPNSPFSAPPSGAKDLDGQ